MVMADIIRDAAIGQIIRYVSGNKLLQYPEEKPDYKPPQAWLDLLESPEKTPAATAASAADSASALSTSVADSDEENQKIAPQVPSSNPTTTTNNAANMDSIGLAQIKSSGQQSEKANTLVPQRTADGLVLVDWYSEDDPNNPQNWSRGRKLGTNLMILVYTFVVYMTSSIYTMAYPGIMAEFNVSAFTASLGLSLYVLGYGVGPLLFSPLGEIASIGRNPVYIVTMFLFVIISIPTALVHNFAGLMVLRFLQGFFGSPCLASGGATLADIYSILDFPFAIIFWTASAYGGPSFGPLLAAFSVPAKGWRWALYEPLWAGSAVFVVMFLFLPETSAPALLMQRAKRIRRALGSDRFVSQSEINQRSTKASAVFFDALIKPMEITIKDPAVGYIMLYTAIIYGIYYSFFEVFPLTYPVVYRMSSGDVSLVFLCIIVSCAIGVAIYTSILYFYSIPSIRAHGFPVIERWLVPSLFAAFLPTIGLFIYAWTARESIHWIVPTLGIVIYGASVFIVMQCIFIYLPLVYGQYAASLFAANDFFRSALACGSVLFAQPLYHNLGIARGTSLLGGLSVIGIIGIWVLYFYGAKLRGMSKFAQSP